MAILSSDLIRQGAAGASTGYTIDNSYFNDAISRTYMTADTGGSFAGNKTFTISFWIKKFNKDSYIGSTRNSFYGSFYGNNNRYDYLQFNVDQLEFASRSGGASTSNGSSAIYFKTNRVFRDVAAWYHIVIAVDTTQDIEDQRVRLYVNGLRETDLATDSQPAKDTLFYSFGDGVEMNVGSFQDYDYGSSYNYIYGDMYFAEFHGLDGYSYDANYFGEFDENGIWIPKEYSGSYGTHGFYLEFKDASSLGSDTSGQGNDFTLRNIASDHQTSDTPTNNLITFNSTNNQRGGGTVYDGALKYVGPGTRTLISLTANIPSTGKWAIAFKVAQVSTNAGWQIGITLANQADFGDATGSNEDLELVRMSTSSSDLDIGDYVNSTSIDPSQPITTSDEFWVAVDMDSGNVYLGIYDASSTSMKWVANDTGLDGNPATGANPTVTFNTTQMPRDNVVFAVGSKQTSQDIYLQRSSDVSGTTPTGYTYFENVKDLL